MKKKIGIAVALVILVGTPLWYFKAPLNFEIGVPKDEQVDSVDGEVRSTVHTDPIFCDKYTHEKGEKYLRHVVNKFSDGKWLPEGTTDDRKAVANVSFLVKKKDYSFFQAVMEQNQKDPTQPRLSEHYCFDSKGALVAYVFQHNSPKEKDSYMYEESYKDGKVVKAEFKGEKEVVEAKEKIKEKHVPQFKNKEELFKLAGYKEQKK